jgi:allophanate hydrolase
MSFEMTLEGVAGFLADGGTAEQVVFETYRRIAACSDPAIWISVRPQGDVLAEARLLDRSDGPRKPLHAVPFAIKDNIDLAGLPTTAACPDFAYQPQADAIAVSRLREQGALAIGKTNLDQFAMGLVGTRSPYGAPRCVFDADYVSGGSSSGSAVAVARGLVAFALGTDTAGSGRVPAAFNNIVGIKPTVGSLSSRGVVPACRSLDCVSIFAASCGEGTKLRRIAAGYDDADPYSRIAKEHRLPETDLRVGILPPAAREFYGDNAAAKAYERAAAELPRLGALAVEIDFRPFGEAAGLLYGSALVAERLAVIEDSLTRFGDSVDPTVRQIALGGLSFTAADTFRAGYSLAALKRQAEAEWHKMDVLLLPTAPTIPRLAAVNADPIYLNAQLGHYTNFVNLLDYAAVAVPAGFTPAGLPFGVTLVGPAGSDDGLAAWADRLHRHLSPGYGADRAALPQLLAVILEVPTIRLGVVGAHLKGQPLNWQLTDRKARCLGQCLTAPDYRLYALTDIAPPKPGLVREPGFDGKGIEIEIWSLDTEAFGSFTAEVPPPLAIGTLQLADGSSVKGFVCEPAGLDGANEITDFGGWRAYLDQISPNDSITA